MFRKSALAPTSRELFCIVIDVVNGASVLFELSVSLQSRFRGHSISPFRIGEGLDVFINIFSKDTLAGLSIG